MLCSMHDLKLFHGMAVAGQTIYIPPGYLIAERALIQSPSFGLRCSLLPTPVHKSACDLVVKMKANTAMHLILQSMSKLPPAATRENDDGDARNIE